MQADEPGVDVLLEEHLKQESCPVWYWYVPPVHFKQELALNAPLLGWYLPSVQDCGAEDPKAQTSCKVA